MNKSNPRIKSNLIWRQVDENTVVVSPQSGQMRVLNGVGSTIWQLLAQNQSPEAIAAHIVNHYDVSAEQAQTDLQTFLADLDKRQLLDWGG